MIHTKRIKASDLLDSNTLDGLILELQNLKKLHPDASFINVNYEEGDDYEFSYIIIDFIK